MVEQDVLPADRGEDVPSVRRTPGAPRRKGGSFRSRRSRPLQLHQVAHAEGGPRVDTSFA